MRAAVVGRHGGVAALEPGGELVDVPLPTVCRPGHVPGDHGDDVAVDLGCPEVRGHLGEPDLGEVGEQPGAAVRWRRRRPEPLDDHGFADHDTVIGLVDGDRAFRHSVCHQRPGDPSSEGG